MVKLLTAYLVKICSFKVKVKKLRKNWLFCMAVSTALKKNQHIDTNIKHNKIKICGNVYRVKCVLDIESNNYVIII